MKQTLAEIQKQRLKEEKIEHLYDIGRGTSLMNQKLVNEGINFEVVEQIQHFKFIRQGNPEIKLGSTDSQESII